MTNAIDIQIRRAQAAVRSGAITREELARQAGLRSTTLTRMLDPDWNPTRRTLAALVEVLDRIGFFCLPGDAADDDARCGHGGAP